MAAREITCTNDDGAGVTLGEAGFSPFILCSAEGIYGMENEVSITDAGMLDGGIYYGSVAKVRDITLTLKDLDGAASSRDLLEEVFKPASEGELVYDDGSHRRMCRYYVEGVASDGKWGPRTYTVGLRCPDPFFYDAEPTVLEASSWHAAFTFQHEFQAAGEALGALSHEKSASISNLSAAEGIGLEIELAARGDVKNPSIAHAESGKRMQIGVAAKPLLMKGGDVLRVTTGANDKHVYLERDGGAREKINQYLSEDSEYVQIGRGENTIGCTAEQGADLLSMAVSYRMRYLGA